MTDHDISDRARRPSTVGTLVYLVLGLIVWAIQLTAIYMAHTLVCTIGAPASIASTFVFVLSAAIAIALVVALLNGDKVAVALGVAADARGRTTYDAIFRLIAVLSIIAIVWSGATALIVTSC
jgi:hypothetical protein